MPDSLEFGGVQPRPYASLSVRTAIQWVGARLLGRSLECHASVTAGGNSSGNLAFNNPYVRQADHTASTASTNTGLGYASYLMGLPDSVSLTTNDTGFWSTPYQAAYFQDDFRVTSKQPCNRR
jgi:hypothetical protein